MGQVQNADLLSPKPEVVNGGYGPRPQPAPLGPPAGQRVVSAAPGRPVLSLRGPHAAQGTRRDELAYAQAAGP